MKLGDICQLVRGNTYKSSLLSETEGPVLLGLGSIEKDGGFKRGSRKHYPGKSDSRIILHPGDLYVSLKDLTQECGLLGAISRVPADLSEGRLTQDTVKLELDSSIGEEGKLYVYWSLRTPQYRKYCRARGTGTTNMSLSRTDFLNWEIPPVSPTRSNLISTFELIDAKTEANAKLNGYLAEQCEGIAEHQTGDVVALASLCGLVSERVDCREADIATYVSTESLLPAKMGKQTASSLPQAGKVTVYKAGDTLVSNIRPYFKKIWYADRAGTCSGDVLVFRANQPEHAGYLYSCLRQDRFFDYVMKGAKGTKMPRGDKNQMLTYEIVNSPSAAAIGAIQTALEQISIANKENDSLAALRDALLPKLMSGEIDVSEVDLTQLNSHLT